jgi:hypothetical protein
LATQIVLPGDPAPAEDVYVLIDNSGHGLNFTVRRRPGERLPHVVADGTAPAGYVPLKALIPAS